MTTRLYQNRTGNFNLAIKAQADKETRAMYEI
jgi:hypothetical protein